MQHARKLVLVDEFDREYKRLQRPVDSVARTHKSLQIAKTLGDSKLADDEKVRQHVADLHRYFNLSNVQQPQQTKKRPVHTTAQPVDRQQQQQEQQSPDQGTQPPPRRRRKRQRWSPY